MKVNFIGFFLSFFNVILCLEKKRKYDSGPDYGQELNREQKTNDYTRWRLNPLYTTLDFVVKVIDDDALPPGAKNEMGSIEDFRVPNPHAGAYKPLGDNLRQGAEFLNRVPKLNEHIVPVAFARKYNEIPDLVRDLQNISRLKYPKRTSHITPPTRTTLLSIDSPNPNFDDNSIDTKVSRKPTRTSSNSFSFRPHRTSNTEYMENPNPTEPYTPLSYQPNVGTTKRNVFPMENNYGIDNPVHDENKISISNPLEVDSPRSDQRKFNDISEILLDEDYNSRNKTDLEDDKKLNSEEDIAMRDINDLLPAEMSKKINEQAMSAFKFDDNNDSYDTVKGSMEEVDKTTDKSIDNASKTGYDLLRIADCNIVRIRKFNFQSTQTLDEIYTQLNVWAEDSHIAKLVDITYGNLTSMDNPIFMMIIDDPSTGQLATLKRVVMIVAGIHARDHHAVSAAMYVLQQLIEKPLDNRHLLEKNRFWIIPVFNPDGYEYSVGFSHRRQWTKNLHQYWDYCQKESSCESCRLRGIRCKLKPCFGVNLDRNFEYQWIPAEELGAENPCGALYAGERQLSEVETSSFAKFLQSQKTKLYAFITFKEGEVLGVMYPYSHTKNKRTFDHVYKDRSSKAASAAYNINGRPYVAGQTSEFLPLFAGGIEDWVDGHLGIENVFTIALFRPTDSSNLKLNTERVVNEGYAAMSSLVSSQAEQRMPIPPVILTHAITDGADRPSIVNQYFLLCLLFWTNP